MYNVPVCIEESGKTVDLRGSSQLNADDNSKCLWFSSANGGEHEIVMLRVKIPPASTVYTNAFVVAVSNVAAHIVFDEGMVDVDFALQGKMPSALVSNTLPSGSK